MDESWFALKEWAVAVSRLLQGREVLLLRKGGLADGPDGFSVEHDRFLFYETAYHQDRATLRPDAWPELDANPGFATGAVARVRGGGRIVLHFPVTTEGVAAALAAETPLTPAAAIERFHFGSREGLVAVVVRAFRLRSPFEFTPGAAQGGCKSFVPLPSRDVGAGPGDALASEPVLDEAAFAVRLARIRSLAGPEASSAGSSS